MPRALRVGAMRNRGDANNARQEERDQASALKQAKELIAALESLKYT